MKLTGGVQASAVGIGEKGRARANWAGHWAVATTALLGWLAQVKGRKRGRGWAATVGRERREGRD